MVNITDAKIARQIAGKTTERYDLRISKATNVALGYTTYTKLNLHVKFNLLTP